MPFPRNEVELKTQGYVFKNKGLCRGCQATICWYQTPAGKLMPLDPGSYEPHWGSCVAREQFKKKKEQG